MHHGIFKSYDDIKDQHSSQNESSGDCRICWHHADFRIKVNSVIRLFCLVTSAVEV